MSNLPDHVLNQIQEFLTEHIDEGLVSRIQYNLIHARVNSLYEFSGYSSFSPSRWARTRGVDKLILSTNVFLWEFAREGRDYWSNIRRNLSEEVEIPAEYRKKTKLETRRLTL